VLARGNVIERISAGAIAPEPGTRVIEGGGRVLMPGLIDNHWHAMFIRPTPLVMLSSDAGYLNFLAGAEATDTLLRGFTTVRDVGGPVFSLKRAFFRWAPAKLLRQLAASISVCSPLRSYSR
jgi:imidazolonepropionase-like amidohydrolase